MDEIKLNCLIIGAGDRGHVFGNIAPNYGAKIVAVADIDEKRRDLMADKHDIPVDLMFEEAEDALNSGLPFDAVYIATPDKTHAKIARMALNKGAGILRPSTSNLFFSSSTNSSRFFSIPFDSSPSSASNISD